MDAFHLGRWNVEPSLNQITCGAETVRLEPKVMRVLVCLAAARGAVVPREQLVEDVWDGVHVVDAAVGRAVYQLRKALTSAGDTQSYIETVRQVGYRLTVQVTPLKALRPPSQPFAGEPRRLRDMAFVLCASILVGGVALEQVAPVFQDLFAPAPIVAVAPASTAPAMTEWEQERANAYEALRQERVASRLELRAERRRAHQALLKERMAANRALREELALDRRERRGLILASAGAGPQPPQVPPPPPAPAPPEAPPAPEPEPPGPA